MWTRLKIILGWGVKLREGKEGGGWFVFASQILSSDDKCTLSKSKANYPRRRSSFRLHIALEIRNEFNRRRRGKKEGISHLDICRRENEWLGRIFYWSEIFIPIFLAVGADIINCSGITLSRLDDDGIITECSKPCSSILLDRLIDRFFLLVIASIGYTII